MIWALLFLLGLAITLIGGSYLARAIRRRNARQAALAIALPVLYWLGCCWLIHEDRKVVARIIKENPDTWQEKVW